MTAHRQLNKGLDMKTKQLWIDENNAIIEQLINGHLTESEFTGRMVNRGFEPSEVSDMIAALMSEQNEPNVREGSDNG